MKVNWEKCKKKDNIYVNEKNVKGIGEENP